jgi:hypothetical protein
MRAQASRCTQRWRCDAPAAHAGTRHGASLGIPALQLTHGLGCFRHACQQYSARHSQLAMCCQAGHHRRFLANDTKLDHRRPSLLVQLAVRKYTLLRNARTMVLKAQWVRWEAGHHRRILADIKFRGSPVASEPAHSVVKDTDFAVVNDKTKDAVCQQCATCCTFWSIRAIACALRVVVKDRSALLTLRWRSARPLQKRRGRVALHSPTDQPLTKALQRLGRRYTRNRTIE